MGHGPLPLIVFAAAGEPSSRAHSPSRAARMTCESLSWPTGGEPRSAQAGALIMTGSEIRERRRGLRAYPYKAARSLLADGLRPDSRLSSGVTATSGSARLARECAARCGHFISAYPTAC
jgi:hypothetical protein